MAASIHRGGIHRHRATPPPKHGDLRKQHSQAWSCAVSDGDATVDVCDAGAEADALSIALEIAILRLLSCSVTERGRAQKKELIREISMIHLRDRMVAPEENFENLSRNLQGPSSNFRIEICRPKNRISGLGQDTIARGIPDGNT